MTVSQPNLDIITFFETILAVQNLSPIQKITLKAIRSEPLDTVTPIPLLHPYQTQEFANEVEMFKFFSGKSDYLPSHYSDASLCFGRRSGKSTTIGAGLAIYYATQLDYTPYLGTSPHATIPIISATKGQAGEVYQAIKNFFLRSSFLFQKYLDGDIERIQDEYSEEDIGKKAKITGGEIKLNNKVVIKVFAADIGKIRGMAVPFAILDENCFFGVEGNDTKNTDKGIYEALAPALSQFQEIEGMALVLKISSPNGQAGLQYTDFLNRTDPDVLHLQVPSWWANPKLSIRYLDKQKKKGMNFFNREYGAEYTASEAAYLDPILIDKTVIRGTDNIDYQKGYRYGAMIDYATRNDLWTFAIGHKEYIFDHDMKEKRERVIIDLLMHWQGSDGAELDPAEVVPEICIHLKRYQVAKCFSDQYAFAALKGLFMKEGCMLKEFTLSNSAKIKMFYSLQVGINSQGLGIVSNDEAIKHLKDLREKRSQGRRLIIEAANNSHDDYAIVIAGVVYQFDKNSPVYIGHHYDGDDEELPVTKDATGKYISTPTAQELAEQVGIAGFYDNRSDHKQKKEGEDDDDGGFWFAF